MSSFVLNGGAQYAAFLAARGEMVPTTPEQRAPDVARFHALWQELHAVAVLADAGVLSGEFDAAAWLETFSPRVPCGVCRKHFNAFRRQHPPAPGQFLAWTVELHNSVNRKLGRAEWRLLPDVG